MTVKIINEENRFGIEIQTDNGTEFRNLRGASYSIPVTWAFENKTYCWFSNYFQGCEGIECETLYTLTK